MSFYRVLFTFCGRDLGYRNFPEGEIKECWKQRFPIRKKKKIFLAGLHRDNYGLISTLKSFFSMKGLTGR